MKNIILIAVIFGAAIFLLAFRKKAESSDVPSSCNSSIRSVRNNNPGNIVKSPSAWEGKIEGSDTRFETFTNWGYGTRALIYLIRKYLTTGRNTVDTFLQSWAGVDASSAYGQFLIDELRIAPGTQIQPSKENINRIAKAVSRFEGNCTVSNENLQFAWNRL